MKNLRNKLASTSGASILMALLVFFMCLMVGGVVLTASVTTAGKHAAAREREQAYLTVSSAARLILAETENDDASLVRTVTENEGNLGQSYPTSTQSLPDTGLFKDIIGEFTGGVMALRYPNPAPDNAYAFVSTPANEVNPSNLPQRTISVTAEELGLDGVTAVFSMDAGFNIKIILCITPPEDGSDYEDCVLTVNVPAVVAESDEIVSEESFPVASGEKDDNGDDIMTLYTVRERSESVGITWGRGTIERGEVH